MMSLLLCMMGLALADTDAPDKPGFRISPGVDIQGFLGAEGLGESRTFAGALGTRLGVDLFYGAVIVSPGATVHWRGGSRVALGGELEVSHIRSGLWGAVGGEMELSQAADIGGAIGWSFLGFEGRYAPSNDNVRLGVRLRFPLGAVVSTVTRQAKTSSTSLD